MQDKQDILNLYTNQHLTLDAIGKIKGITRERVRQILTVFPEYREERAERHLRVRAFFPCKNGCGKEIYKLKTHYNKRFCSRKCFLEFRIKAYSLIKEKKCSHCGIIKPMEDFYTLSGTFRKYPSCKNCQANFSRQWKKTHPDAVRKINLRAINKYLSNPKNYQLSLERARAYYRKIKEDPVKYRKFLEKERERYRKRMADPSYREKVNKLARLRYEKN